MCYDNSMEELEEIFISKIAKEKKITIPQATSLIERCIRLVSTRLGVPFSDVYAAIHNPERLGECLRGKCDDFDLEKCQKSCECVVFEEKCYARYFEDREKMNEDPDSYVEGMPTSKLADLVKLSSYLYYNYDGGGLTDNTFDALEYHLNKRLKTQGRRYEKIGAPVLEKMRVVLPYPMASLDKAKPGSSLLLEFLSSPSKLVWTPKLDGVSGLLEYKNGVVSKIYTRGNGTIGGNVTYLKDFVVFPVIKDPKFKNIVIRGEFVVNKRNWEEKYTGSYSNARSFISAKINSGHVSQGMTDIDFVPYEIVDLGVPGAKVPKPSEVFRILDSQGFGVIQSGSLESPTVFEIMLLYKKMREASSYYIDGLVLSIDEPREVVTALKNPRHSIAFKMRLEEQVRKTKILNVEWNISRYGRLVPVASYESVYVEGARLHRASAFNAAHVRDWSLGKGTVIKVARSGDVIPTIVDVEVNEEIEPIFPPESLGWHWKGVDIFLNDIEGNTIVQIKRMEHFFVTIGVPRLRIKTLEKFWANGFHDIKAITNGKSEDFIIKGVGKKSADGFYKNIHETMRKTRIDRYIPASTTLELGIGRKLVKQVMRYYPTILEDDEETIKKMLTKKEIPGIGAKRISNISKNIPKFKEFLFSLNRKDVEYAIDQDRMAREKVRTGGYNPKIRGKTFVLTGFFGKIDYELEDYIYDNFGNFSSTVTSSTAAVVTANILDVTSKMLTAHSMGIKVLSIDEFVELYDIPRTKTKKTDDPLGREIPIDPVDPDE